MSASPPEGFPRIMVSVPAERVPARAILPALYELVEAHTQNALAVVAAEGRTVSCKAGCAACCRYFIPVSDVEAYALADLIERMPEPRRSTIKQRFADAEARLAGWRPLDALIREAPQLDADHKRMVEEYFRLGIACPFLEAESCSIYPDRPLACREHLVTSPAAFCASHGPGERVKGVRRKFVSQVLWYLTSEVMPPRAAVMPLSLALHWVTHRAGKERRRKGIEWLRRFSLILQNLAQHHRLNPPPSRDNA
jgi:Fe-S-cluster containining protein